MKIIKAESAGFCFGVKRAVDTVYKCTETGTDEKIYTYGPIIHNEEVVKDMEKRGVRVIRSEEDLAALKEGTVIIRSHGVEKRVYEELEKKGIHIVDATCPFVKKIHKIVEKHSEQGDRIIIIGNPDHPEVQGIRGWAKSPVSVIRNVEEAESFSCPADQKICIVAQTTFNYNKFKELVEIINEKGYNITIKNTICNATEERQTEARDIARKVSAMIVIGDKSSSNTRKLYEICKGECEDTFYIQTLRDLNLNDLRFIDSIGITAGASTPNNIIEEVYTNVREFCRDVS